MQSRRWVGVFVSVLVGSLVNTAAIAQGFTPSSPAALNTNADSDSGLDDYPHVTTDGTGNWVAVWHSGDTLGGTIGSDSDIFVSRSTDLGATWTTVASLNTNAATDSGTDWFPQVATDGLGNWVAVWQSSDSLSSTIGTDRDILVARSTDNGATWTAPAALNTNAATDSGDDEQPQLATDGQGNWVAVWLSTENLGGTIGTDDDIFVSRSTDNGATWTAPATLNTNASTDSGNDGAPQVTTDGLGNWVALWESDDTLSSTIGTDDDVLVSRSTDNGATWTAPAALNTNADSDSGIDLQAQITTDGSGNWVAVWTSTNDLGATIGTDADILVSQSTDNGATWTAPAALNTSADSDSGDDSFPNISTDGQGNWVTAWTTQEQFGGTLGFDDDLLVSRSTNNGATWTAPAVLNTNADSDSETDRRSPLATDGLGNWIATWVSDGLSGTTGFDFDILASTWAIDLDSDSDGLTDYEEFSTYGTDRFDSDSDDDGLEDGAEVNTYSTDPLLADTDSDGLDDGEEVNTYSTDPLVADSDSDGLDDGAEVNTHLTDPLVADTDSDGLDDGDEVNTHLTDPLVADTDSDGLDDGAEVNTHLTDPLVADTDSDGLDDGAEVNTHLTDPLLADTDGDGLDDGDEVNTYSTDPLLADTDSDGLDDGAEVNTYSSNPSDADSDNDGFGDGAEVLDDTDPNSAANFGHFQRLYPTALNTNAAMDSGSDVLPKVATDGQGNWVAVWESSDSLSSTIGTDRDILVARSTDNGATWTAPAALNTNAATDAGNDLEPQVATDGQGNWVAVWHSSDSLGASIGTDRDILVARSTDNGATWTAPTAVNTNAATDSGDDLRAQVSTDELGNWIAAWESDENLGGTIGTDVDILISRSTDNGASWTAPAALNTNAATDAGNDLESQVATDGQGNWVAVWESSDSLSSTIGTDGDILVARSTDNGATWTAPAALNTNAATDAGDDLRAQVSTDELGNWIAVWESDENLGGTIGTDGDILVARSTDSGATWTAPAALNTNAAADSGDDLDAHVSTDGQGNWVAIWQSVDTLSGTIGSDDDILVARSTDNGATWTAPVPLNTNAAADAGDDEYPRVITDGQGNWVAVWHSGDALGGTVGVDNDVLVSNWTLAAFRGFDDVYVDFTSGTNGTGTQASPLDNLGDAPGITNDGGKIHLDPGDSSETFTGSSAIGTGNQVMTLEKNGAGGSVRIGVP